jgi:hypothetical protein
LRSYQTHTDEELFSELTKLLKQGYKGNSLHQIYPYEKEVLDRYAKSLGKNGIEDLDFILKDNNSY